MKLLLAVVGHRWHLFLLGLAALAVSALASSAAGIFLGTASDIIALIPGLMVLVPPSLNMRGSISGVMASRLSSSMHRGEFEVDFSSESVLGSNTRASFYSTVLLAFVLGIFAWAVSYLNGITQLGISDFILISVISGAVSGLLIILFTLFVTIVCYRRGVDLDMIASPAVTTTGDIITIPILVLTAVIIMNMPPEFRQALLWGVVVICAAAFAFQIYRKKEGRAGGILKETVPLLVPLCFVGVLAGMTYTLDLDEFITYAVFLILIPPFTGGCGSIGGILCSRLSTGMHMGEISPSALPQREVLGHFAESYLYCFFLLPLLAVIAYSAAIIFGLDTPDLTIIMTVSVCAGLLVVTFVNLLGYLTASISFRYGFDPDNFGIPVITSFIDLAGAALLVTVINLLL